MESSITARTTWSIPLCFIYLNFEQEGDKIEKPLCAGAAPTSLVLTLSTRLTFEDQPPESDFTSDSDDQMSDIEDSNVTSHLQEAEQENVDSMEVQSTYDCEAMDGLDFATEEQNVWG